jgi:hypothetical protein
MQAKYRVLILGASYGSLLGTKLLLAGHAVRLVCTRATAELINRAGTVVRLPIRDRKTPVTIYSKDIDADLSASTPDAVDPADFDLVVLAMQEPHYSDDGVRELMERIAAARVPCLAIMNMPPLPFLKRIPGLRTRALGACYTDASVWRGFEPGLMTLASPDPQAVRPAGEAKNVLQVGLATNFKVAPFAEEAHTAMLQRLQDDIDAIRFHAGDGAIELPVKLKVHDSLFVPLAKWAMLLTGNYRCIQRDKMISIQEAVHADIEASREVYNLVAQICIQLGANEADLVPFEKYAQAAQGLRNPSSAARALANGATHIERVDLLIQQIAHVHGLPCGPVDEIVPVVDYHLRLNRARQQATPAVAAAAFASP